MAGRMLSQPRNRADRGIDGPMFDDGFYTHRHFKGKRRTGAPTGGRRWRRALRASESQSVTRDTREELQDRE